MASTHNAALVIGVLFCVALVLLGRPSDAIFVFVFTMYTRFGLTVWPYSFLTVATISFAVAVGFFLSTLRIAKLLFFLGSARSDFDGIGFLATEHLNGEFDRVQLIVNILTHLWI